MKTQLTLLTHHPCYAWIPPPLKRADKRSGLRPIAFVAPGRQPDVPSIRPFQGRGTIRKDGGGLAAAGCVFPYKEKSQELFLGFFYPTVSSINRRGRRPGAPHNTRTTAAVVQSQLCWLPLAVDSWQGAVAYATAPFFKTSPPAGSRGSGRVCRSGPLPCLSGRSSPLRPPYF